MGRRVTLLYPDDTLAGAMLAFARAGQEVLPVALRHRLATSACAALFFAALTSLISMLELATRVMLPFVEGSLDEDDLRDLLGRSRRQA